MLLVRLYVRLCVRAPRMADFNSRINGTE